ncbi:sigma-70 family RNA polymerase sigma factor [Streptomyces albidus (ex Kaewkla and Franco 2022)]|uniref:sigma-70 family RNA polymerase sigma factor n=1 Tax=Streptomyces albidus (ex Kaewkla and Franco 2022) TaxID=722709 RepID=UPI0015EE8FD6|nr:sigma-70 family RNA polymerase sigma factor [Streptomyces albidus (ex Kaewkla and Franco 2022)]
MSSAEGTALDGTDEVPASDVHLLLRMREGDSSAYEELYRRHVGAVRRYARTCCRSSQTAEDLTNEVFARTLQAVRGGKGPIRSVRAYLLTSVRHVGAAWARTEQREQLVEDFAVFAQSAAGGKRTANDTPATPGADVRAMQAAEQTLVVQAFKSLSERDQTVLWHTTVEEANPRDVAPMLGLSDNATAVAAHRARENLRRAYLQAHVSDSLTTGGDCARYADRLGAYARGGLRTRAESGMRKHLDQCARCQTAAAEVMNLNERMRVLVPVAFIGWFASAGGTKTFAALLAGTGTTAAAGGSAAAGGGSAGGSAGSASSEGLGMPAKVGLGALTATLAGVTLVFALAGTSAKEQAAGPEPGPSAAPGVPPEATQKPGEEGEQRPGDPGGSEQGDGSSDSELPLPGPRPEPPGSGVDPDMPSPSPSGTEAQEPSAPPSPTPSPTTPTEPPPETPPPPPAEDFQVNQLHWSLLSLGDDQGKPRLRAITSSWLWQRYDMSVGGTPFEYGVSVHAPSSVTIELNRSCKVFEAQAGVDDVTRRAGPVRFSVYADGARLWTSRAIRGGESPVPVHVPLTGDERTVRLKVTPQSPFSIVALADWAEAKISCR